MLEFHPYDLASTIKKLEPEFRLKIYASLTNKELADIFSYLEGEESAELFMNSGKQGCCDSRRNGC